jgi:hypothetical protein
VGLGDRVDADSIVAFIPAGDDDCRAARIVARAAKCPLQTNARGER